MKKNILFTVLLCCTMRGLAQIPANPPIDLGDHPGLLSLLFDSKLFAPNGEVMWKPLNYSDGVSANFSDDGYLHTQLDTILYFPNFQIRQIESRRHILDTHISFPIL